MTALGAGLLFVAGTILGVALPEDAAEMEAANSAAQRSREQIDSLGAKLTTTEAKNAELTASLNDAEARAVAAGDKAEGARKKLDARETRLDKRAEALEARDKAITAREEEWQIPDVTASSPGDGARSAAEFDRAYAVDIATDIIEDISSVDERLRDGGLVSSALSLLSDSYGRLLDAGYPPGVDQSTYYARVTTLQSFSATASDEYYDAPSEASARYAVVRKQTGVLLADLNKAMGTTFQLP